MHLFDYHRPASLDAARRFGERAADGKYLAGGQTLIPVLKQRLLAPSDLIDLSAIPGLRGIGVAAGAITIGATTPHVDVARSAEVGEAIPALAMLAGLIGDPAVRNRGTIGGSIANNDPSADYPAACLALGATIVTDLARIPAEEFFLGLFETALRPHEIVVAVEFPVTRRAAYVKFPNRASRYAMAGVFVADTGGGIRVAVTGAGQGGVFRWTEAEDALGREFAPGRLAGLEPPADEMIEDIHGSGQYRANLVAIMAQRAVAKALMC